MLKKFGETDAERGELHKCRTDTMTRETEEDELSSDARFALAYDKRAEKQLLLSR